MTETHTHHTHVGHPSHRFRKKLVLSLTMMVLAAGVAIFLGWQKTSGPSENQTSGNPFSGDFNISMSAGADDRLSLNVSPLQEETVSQETRVTVENTTAGYDEDVTLSYSPSVQGDWLGVSFSPPSGTPTFTSTVKVSIDTGELNGYTGLFQITITGTGVDNVSHSVPIEVTIR